MRKSRHFILMSCSGALVSMLTVLNGFSLSARAQDIEHDANGSGRQVERSRGILKGSVTIQDIAAPTSGQWDTSVLPKLKLGTRLCGDLTSQPEGIWYRIPSWAAGTWRGDDKHRLSVQKTTNVDETTRIGSEIDRKGDIWAYSRGFVMTRPWDAVGEENSQVVNVMGGDIPLLPEPNSFQTIRRDSALTVNSKKQDTQIIRMLATLLKQKYVRLENGQLHQVCNMTHIVNEGFDGVHKSTDWSRTLTKIAPFKVDTTPELVASFRAYLRAHDMADLVPVEGVEQDSLKSSALPGF